MIAFTPEILHSFDKSVLCWLATASADGQPNVSPKEIFLPDGDRHVLIANIASPQSVRNIREHPSVCVSFVDIWVQKGYQLKGVAEILDHRHADYARCKEKLETLTGGNFPFHTLTRIEVLDIRPIIAPRYRLFPETTEAEQIASARRAYGVD
ncbi:pyridoxamine 5'-phosphate oxidase family protein [Pontibacter sp. G13]|uniref:pyridoxamine 5'-phosphate oxidase family protein n=1 Tax=Pontibacter sp. G13 TaxID=3074898 RepID=UPI00288A47FC|nr:pyridoxamine 5'-phosphate oxidase family protein [Pontibacter sp. G13]WNJ18382.1 pyridoxamine 5'-phosphate oxidase family protein [Pontibacter sp. G13]